MQSCLTSYFLLFYNLILLLIFIKIYKYYIYYKNLIINLFFLEYLILIPIKYDLFLIQLFFLTMKLTE